MSKTYLKEAATASKLITKFGGPAVVVRTGAPTGLEYDPSFGGEITFAALIADIAHSVTRSENSVIEQGEKAGVMVMVDGDVPSKTDSIRISGEDFVFVELKPLKPNPDGSVVLYEYVAKSAIA